MRTRSCILGLVLCALLAACAARPLPTQRQPEDGAKSETRFLAFAVLAAAAANDEARLSAYLDPACREWASAAAKQGTERTCRAWLIARDAALNSAEGLLELQSDTGARCFAAYETKGAETLGLSLADWKKRVGPKGLVWVFPGKGQKPLVMAFGPSAKGWVLTGGY